MEEKVLKDLMERFFNAELTVEEEHGLYQYLSENDVPAELRRDKEAVMALCGSGDEMAAIPDGAAERLEAMIDELAQLQEFDTESGGHVSEGSRKTHKIPRFLGRCAAAAAIAFAVYMTLPETEECGTQTKPVPRQPVTMLAENQEEDTFDNPEDAMECFKGALGNMMLALNTTHKNTRKMENTLNKAVAPYKNMIKINIQ